MEDFQEKQIFYTLKEYQNNYNILLKEYLSQHEDFDELMFLEIEMQFYSLCYDNSNVVFGDFGNGPENCINGGHCELFIQEINEVISYSEGYDVKLSIKYKATFSKIIKFLEDKKKDATTQTNKTFPIFDKVIFKTNTYNPNLTNDPLFNPANEYLILKEKFTKEYQSRTAQYPDFDYLFLVDDDVNLKEWEKTQKEKINIAFLKLIKDLNNNKIFFFGCSFDNYKSNYTKRLNQFLNNYDDTSVEDFIISEISFLENLIFDFENDTGGMDEFSMSDVDIFNKASYVVSMISYEQYCYSNNKKIKFLYDQKNNIINSKSVLPKTELHKTELPVFKDVFFVHYQCEDFNVSDEITSLSIFADDKVIEFKNKSEAENIEEYCNTVNDLLERGQIPIHWSQNRPYFGVEHIMSRFHKLTGKKIELEYKNSLNLSVILKHKFGEEYVNHPRLDNLALLNSFNGNSTKEKGQRTFDANRVLLLSKIYFGILNKTLKIGIYNAEETAVVPEQSTNDIEVIEQSNLKGFPAKYHALAYIFELLVDGNKPPQNFDGNFKKDEIIKIGRERCDNSGQNFYNYVRDHFALVTSKTIKISIFKNNWKEIVLNITNNKKEVALYIENNNL